jgi:hypothetical protein
MFDSEGCQEGKREKKKYGSSFVPIPIRTRTHAISTKQLTNEKFFSFCSLFFLRNLFFLNVLSQTIMGFISQLAQISILETRDGTDFSGTGRKRQNNTR